MEYKVVRFCLFSYKMSNSLLSVLILTAFYIIKVKEVGGAIVVKIWIRCTNKSMILSAFIYKRKGGT